MQGLLADYFQTLRWGEPQGDERLWLLPIFSEVQAPYRYDSLAEAIERAAIEVTEVDGGSVPELLVRNLGGTAILILDGEELVGAMQNRVLNSSVVVPRKAKLRVPVSCVEQGRWSEVSQAFQGSANHLSHGHRYAKAADVSGSLASGAGRRGDQGNVWNLVAEQAARFGVNSSTGAMADTFQAVEEQLAEMVAQHPIRKRQKGLVAIRNGQVLGLEVVSSSRVYQHLHEKLVRSYAIDALDPPRSPARPSTDDASAFLDRLLEAQCQAYPGVGLGTELRLHANGLQAVATVDAQTVLHLTALSSETTTTLPFERSYWVEPGRLLAGCYPGDPHPSEQRRKLVGLREAGVQCVINLVEASEVGHHGAPFAPYQEELRQLGAGTGRPARCLRFPIRDMTAPTAAVMAEVLDAIDLALEAGQTVYLHCWGGRGRTGTVVGCWLARHGRATGEAALRRIQKLRAAEPTAHKASPETPGQRELVTTWRPGQ